MPTISKVHERRTIFSYKEIRHASFSSILSNDITQMIVSGLSELSISLETLELGECDGTVTNNVWKNCVIDRLENHV